MGFMFLLMNIKQLPEYSKAMNFENWQACISIVLTGRITTT